MTEEILNKQKRKKGDYPNEIKEIMNILKFKNNKLYVHGSYKYKDVYYTSDIDLYTKINKEKPQTIKEEINNIINNICNHDDLYIMELKIQLSETNKHKYNKPCDEKKEIIKDIDDNIKKIDFIKIDTLYYSRTEYKFIEISIIYDYKIEKLTDENYKNKIIEDIKKFKKEKKYFKMLKRLYLLTDNEELIKYFNSEEGKKYQLLNNLKSIQEIKKMYKDKETQQKIKYALKSLKSNNKTLSKDVEKLETQLNKNAFKIYKKYDVL